MIKRVTAVGRTEFSLLLALICLLFTAIGCGRGSLPTETVLAAAPAAEQKAQVASFELTSTAFAASAPIPGQYTCDGDDVSPPLQWSEPPAGTQGFALIADDPDAPAGTWVHWVLYNLPVQARSLPPALSDDAELSDGSRHGSNGWQRLGYGGPCPPSGTHRYFFRLYALDAALNLAPGETKEALLAAMEGHILAQAELMGVYTRK
jgi:Raf kinase inhibitor-like YbhB/YbcL family protein